jgi:hypothetical protein
MGALLRWRHLYFLERFFAEVFQACVSLSRRNDSDETSSFNHSERSRQVQPDTAGFPPRRTEGSVSASRLKLKLRRGEPGGFSCRLSGWVRPKLTDRRGEPGGFAETDGVCE